jgi:hypothetical protein
LSVLLHELRAIFPFCKEKVVRPTHERDIVRAVVAATGEGALVMKLQEIALRASFAVLVDEAAAPPVPLPYGAPNCGWDVTR